MADINRYISKIKTAIYGKDVRGSLADGLDAVNKETEAATALAQETEQRQTSIEKQFDDQIANMTLDDPSSAELVAGRTNVNTGKSYDTIGRRLDAEHADVTAQLAKIENPTYSKEDFLEPIKVFDYYNSDITYPILQGGTIVNGEVIFALSQNDENAQTAKLIKVDMSTWSKVGETTGVFYHANDITYNPFTNKIYVNYANVHPTKDAILDATTLTTIGEVDVTGYQHHGIAYDKQNNQYVLAVRGGVFRIVDENFNKIKDVNVEGNSQRPQGIEVHDNLVWMAQSNLNSLMVYDFEGNLKNKFTFDDSMGELEFISHMSNGTFLLGFFDSAGKYCFYTVDTTNNSNISTGKRKLKNTLQSFNNGVVRLYVDKTYGGVVSDGSSSKPFKTIGEAVEKLPLLCEYAILYIRPGTYIEDVEISNLSYHLYLEGTNSATYSTLKSLMLNNCTLVTYKYIEINGSKSYNNYNAGLILRDSNVYLQGGKIGGSDVGVLSYNSDINITTRLFTITSKTALNIRENTTMVIRSQYLKTVGVDVVFNIIASDVKGGLANDSTYNTLAVKGENGILNPIDDITGVLTKPSRLVDGTNLNTLKQGTYFCGSDSSAQTMVNCPVTSSFTLLVMKVNDSDAYMSQFLIANTTGDAIFFRPTTNLGWFKISATAV